MASCGFCFNCSIERPGHGLGSCPEPPTCSECPGHHLSLLHTDKVQDGCRPSPSDNKESNDKGDKPPATPHPATHEGVNTSRTASANSNKLEPIPISSAGLSTSETQVLLNVVQLVKLDAGVKIFFLKFQTCIIHTRTNWNFHMI